MRRVTLIVGNGQLAHHFQHYFSLLKITFFSWNRTEPIAELHEKVTLIGEGRILLLITDNAIESFIEEHLQNTPAILIHCSGSLVTQKAYGLHPLMTFSKNLYSEAVYRSIPFVIDENATEWDELFPDLPNSHFRLNPSLKAKYHALCVLSGNFTCILWQKLFKDFEEELQLPASAAHAYLTRQMQNLIEGPKVALTGPLVRNDHNTIAQNLQALEGDPFQELYQSFLQCYQKIKDLP